MMLVNCCAAKLNHKLIHTMSHIGIHQSCVIMYVAIFAANKVLLPVYISLQDTRNVWMFYLR